MVDLIDPDAILTAPITPLRAVNATEISFFVGPLVPDRHAVFVVIFEYNNFVALNYRENHLWLGKTFENIFRFRAVARIKFRNCILPTANKFESTIELGEVRERN